MEWLKENWVKVLGFVLTMVAYFAVVTVGALMVMVAFVVPLTFLPQMLMLALMMGFVDRRAIQLSTWVFKKVTKKEEVPAEELTEVD